MVPSRRPRLAAVNYWVFAVTLLAVSPLFAEPPAGKRPQKKNRPVKLWPPATQPAAPTPGETTLELDGWLYRASKAADPRDRVPWELTVTPIGENATVYKQGALPQVGQPTEMKRLLTAVAR